VSGKSPSADSTCDGASTSPTRDGGHEQSSRRSHRRTAWWGRSITKCGPDPKNDPQCGTPASGAPALRRRCRVAPRLDPVQLHLLGGEAPRELLERRPRLGHRRRRCASAPPTCLAFGSLHRDIQQRCFQASQTSRSNDHDRCMARIPSRPGRGRACALWLWQSAKTSTHRMAPAGRHTADNGHTRGQIIGHRPAPLLVNLRHRPLAQRGRVARRGHEGPCHPSIWSQRTRMPTGSSACPLSWEDATGG
jgi:hypothetical protein